MPAQVGFRLPDGAAIAHTTGDPAPDAAQRIQLVEWLAEHSGLPVIPKGVMHPEDARVLVSAGAAGVIVSNHGARQLPRAIGALDALAPIADRIGGDAVVYLDGGVRSAPTCWSPSRPARAPCSVGRPLAWALAVGGARAVERSIEQLRAELVEAAALCGVNDLTAVPRELLAGHTTERDLAIAREGTGAWPSATD